MNEASIKSFNAQYDAEHARNNFNQAVDKLVAFLKVMKK